MSKTTQLVGREHTQPAGAETSQRRERDVKRVPVALERHGTQPIGRVEDRKRQLGGRI